MIRSFRSLVLSSTFLLTAAALLPAQASKVLVIYNSHPSFSSASLEVAQHYQTRRGLPTDPGRLCGISFPNSEEVSSSTWLSTYRNDVRNCINTLGRANVLYVVMSYNTPFRIQGPSQKYALDSYVADVFDSYSALNFPLSPAGNHGYYADARSAGNIYPAFRTLDAFRAAPRSTLIFSVWRLDGVDKDAAKGLVDRAVDIEAAGGLAPGGVARGKVYSDGRLTHLSDSSDDSYTTAEFDLERLATMASTAGLPFHKDYNLAELGNAPALTEVTDAMFYCGWYSLLNYFDIFKHLGAPGWMPGAIGWHLDSASATSPRSGNSWSAKALQRGITITSGSVDEPFLQGLAHPDVVFRHLLQGGNVGDAFLRGEPWLKWMIMNIGDPLYRPFPGGRAPFDNPAFTEDTMATSTQLQVSGPITYTLTLAQPAVSDVTVSWFNTWQPYHLTKAPATTTILAGQRTTSVTITTTDPVPEGYIASIATATYNGKTAMNSVIVPSMLEALATSATTVKGGVALPSILWLSIKAPNGGFPVTLTSSHPGILQVPPSLTVPWGALVAAVNITTTAGQIAVTDVTITATSGPYRLTKVIRVIP